MFLAINSPFLISPGPRKLLAITLTVFVEGYAVMLDQRLLQLGYQKYEAFLQLLFQLRIMPEFLRMSQRFVFLARFQCAGSIHIATLSLTVRVSLVHGQGDNPHKKDLQFPFQPSFSSL